MSLERFKYIHLIALEKYGGVKHFSLRSASIGPRSGFLNLPRAARTFAHGDREHNGAGRGVADALWHLLTRSLSGVEETLRN